MPDRAGGPAPTSPQPAQDDGVGGDGDQDEQAEDRVLDELADTRPTQQTLLQGFDHQHTEQRPNHRARSAEDVDASDHDRGDDLQLQTLRGGHGDVAESHQEHESGQTGERAADGERGEYRPLHGESRRARRFRVRSDGVEPPSKRQVAQRELTQERDQQRDGDHQPQVVATRRQQGRARYVIQPVRQIGRGDVRAPENSTSTTR